MGNPIAGPVAINSGVGAETRVRVHFLDETRLTPLPSRSALAPWQSRDMGTDYLGQSRYNQRATPP